ncbi:MAG: DUF302 domain-containing protein [Thermodesulfobacteriota bacterium]
MSKCVSSIKIAGSMAIMFVLLVSVFSHNVLAATEVVRPVEVTSSLSFDQTVDKVRTLVAKNGMMVMGEIDQGKMLSMTGLKLKGISLIVGNPTVGKKIFSSEPAAGLAIPIRLYIFEDSDHRVVISYYKPSELLSQYHDNEIDMVGTMLDQKLEKLTSMSSK